MKIVGFQKLSMVDYPNKTACTIFTEGCNYRCPWCHNSPLVLEKSDSYYEEIEIINYIDKRKGIIDAICVSGGEPTLQPDLITFLEKLRNHDILVKLDTNGTNPKILEEIIERRLVDYVAMDFKNSFSKYAKTVGLGNVNLDNIKRSIEILKEGKVDYEFRTTIIKEFHDIEDIKEIQKEIGNSKYYLQNFEDNENVVYEGLHGFEVEELKNLKKLFPDLIIRGQSMITNEEE